MASDKKLSDIFSALSDEDVVKMLEMIFEHRELHASDFDSPKRYYSRLSKLKENLIIRKQKNVYKITAFGFVIYDALMSARKALDLHWKLQIIDALNDRVPEAERNEIIESLIPDEKIRKVLIENLFK